MNKAIERARGAGNRRGLIIALTGRGNLELKRAELQRARASFLEALELRRVEWENIPANATAVLNMAVLEVTAGAFREAVDWLAEALPRLAEFRDREGVAYCIRLMASIAAATGNAEAAAGLLGASASLFRSVGASLEPVEAELRARAETETRESLGGIEYDRLHAEAAVLDPEAATRLGLDEFRRTEVL